MRKTTLAILLASACVFGACSRSEGERGAEASPSPATGAADPGRPLPSPIPEVVARVNGQPIRIGQLLPVALAELQRFPGTQRDERRPEALRLALKRYIDRELLLQEALARGVTADTRAVDWAYDQARREFPEEAAWAEFLAERALEPQSFKAEIRVQHTVSALLEREGGGFAVSEAEARAAFEADPAAFSGGGNAPATFESVRERVEMLLRQKKRDETADTLIEKLRARARIETFL